MRSGRRAKPICMLFSDECDVFAETAIVVIQFIYIFFIEIVFFNRRILYDVYDPDER